MLYVWPGAADFLAGNRGFGSKSSTGNDMVLRRVWHDRRTLGGISHGMVIGYLA